MLTFILLYSFSLVMAFWCGYELMGIKQNKELIKQQGDLR